VKISSGFVDYGRRKIEFRYGHANRKSLEIAVLPDQSVMVKVPLGTKRAEIDRRVAKRARWILRQQNYFRQFEPRTPARCYVSGETHLYLGKRYRLKIKKAHLNDVKMTRGCLEVHVEGTLSSQKCKNLMDKWYAGKTVEKCGESFKRCLARFKKFPMPQPRLQIKRLKKRWGSLSVRGTLTLNKDLIRAPKECIDYVVTHELCHLLHKDHDARFYRLLERVMPDWERRKQKLEQFLS